MMLRFVVGILGLFFGVQAIHWIARPAAAADALGMPLLDGIGRSTQVGDIGALFLALSMMSLLGAYLKSPVWLRAGALLVGSAAVMRTLAWGLQGADFAAAFIGIETGAAAVLLFAASRLEIDARAS